MVTAEFVMILDTMIACLSAMSLSKHRAYGSGTAIDDGDGADARGVAAEGEVDTALSGYVALLQELVRQPSPLGDVRAAQAIVFRHLLQLGLARAHGGHRAGER